MAGTTCAVELSALTRGQLNLTVTLIDPQSVIKACSLVAKITRSAFDLTVNETDANKWCADHGIHFVNDRAIRIHNRSVHCKSGAVFPFSACCIATGARPYLPPALRALQFSDGVVTLRDTDSVQALKKKLAVARRAIVVGGGGIAMELAHEITGCDVVWLMKGTHIGSAFFDKRAAQCLSKLFGLDTYVTNQVDQDLMHTPDSKCNQSQRGGSGGSLPSETVMAPVRSSQWKPLESFGCGVGPEWVSRRFEPILLDRNGSIQTRAQAKYTQLKGTIDSPSKKAQIVLESEVRQLVKDETGEWPIVAILSDGTEVGCDVVLAGTGVVPNVEWLHGSGIDIGRDMSSKPSSHVSNSDCGIVVSAENMSTNVPGVFAAGDCTTVNLETVGTDWMQMRLWSQAQTAGRACAQSMASFLRGEAAACAGLDFEVFAHATQFFDKKVVLLGRYNAQGLHGDYKMLESGGEKDDGYYVRVVVLDGHVRGALLVGEVDKAETFENLILDGLDISRFGAELVDPHFDIEDYFD